MRPSLRLVVILIGALLLRGFSSAYALPMPQGAKGVLHGAKQTAAQEHRHDATHAADGGQCCNEQHDGLLSAVPHDHGGHVGHADHGGANDTQGGYGTSSCKIVCDLGTAPALVPPAVALPSLPPAAHAAPALQLSVGRILPPEDPPPRR